METRPVRAHAALAALVIASAASAQAALRIPLGRCTEFTSSWTNEWAYATVNSPSDKLPSCSREGFHVLAPASVSTGGASITLSDSGPAECVNARVTSLLGMGMGDWSRENTLFSQSVRIIGVAPTVENSVITSYLQGASTARRWFDDWALLADGEITLELDPESSASFRLRGPIGAPVGTPLVDIQIASASTTSLTDVQFWPGRYEFTLSGHSERGINVGSFESEISVEIRRNTNGVSAKIPSIGPQGQVVDVDQDGDLDAFDLDAWVESPTDLNADGLVDNADRAWIEHWLTIMQVAIDDCNGNGRPDSVDLVRSPDTLDTNGNGVLDACESTGLLVLRPDEWLVRPNGGTDHFGRSIGLSNNEIVVSAPLAVRLNGEGERVVSGAIYTFREDGDGDWSLSDVLENAVDQGQGTRFGGRIAIDDGRMVLTSHTPNYDPSFVIQSYRRADQEWLRLPDVPLVEDAWRQYTPDLSVTADPRLELLGNVVVVPISTNPPFMYPLLDLVAFAFDGTQWQQVDRINAGGATGSSDSPPRPGRTWTSGGKLHLASDDGTHRRFVVQNGLIEEELFDAFQTTSNFGNNTFRPAFDTFSDERGSVGLLARRSNQNDYRSIGITGQTDLGNRLPLALVEVSSEAEILLWSGPFLFVGMPDFNRSSSGSYGAVLVYRILPGAVVPRMIRAIVPPQTDYEITEFGAMLEADGNRLVISAPGGGRSDAGEFVGGIAALVDLRDLTCFADIAPPFGLVDLSDITAFVSAFLSNDPAIDADRNGLFDLADISAFVASFTAGCP